MHIPLSRRHMLYAAPLTALAAPPPAAPDPADSYPAQPADLVRETVTVAHGNFKRLKELVDARPDLAKAAVDWGFGDWEDALGAASHVGNREIAEYLIANGARPTLFSAAMLGQLDVVKALVAAQPGAQRIAGPHSISLLAHAKAGGKRAEAVLAYLESLGDAGSPVYPALAADAAAALAGVYVFGPGANDAIEILEKNRRLSFTRKGGVARGLVHTGGGNTFHPIGASAVRVKFEDRALTVHDGGAVVTARRR